MREPYLGTNADRHIRNAAGLFNLQTMAAILIAFSISPVLAETVRSAQHGAWTTHCDLDDITDEYSCSLWSVVELQETAVDEHEARLVFTELMGGQSLNFSIEPRTLRAGKEVILRVDRNDPVAVAFDLAALSGQGQIGQPEREVLDRCGHLFDGPEDTDLDAQRECMNSFGTYASENRVYYVGETHRSLIDQFKKGRRAAVRYKRRFLFEELVSTAHFSLIGFSKAYEKYLEFRNDPPQ